MFGGGDSCKEFRFSGTGSCDGLGLAAVGDGATSQLESVASGGALFAKVVGMGGIDKAGKLGRVNMREGRKVSRMLKTRGWIGWEGGVPFGCGFAISKSPRLGLTEVFGHLFEEGVVMWMGTGGEFAEGDGRVANVRATGDVGVEELAQESAVAKTLLGSEVGMLGCTFNRAGVLIHGRDGLSGKGNGIFGGGGFRGCGPAVGFEDTIEVGGAGEDDGIVILLNVNAVELGEEAKVLERWVVFRGELEAFAEAVVELDGNGFVRAGEGKIINLAEEEDAFSIDDGGVDGFVVGGVAEAKLIRLEDAVDVCLP